MVLKLEVFIEVGTLLARSRCTNWVEGWKKDSCLGVDMKVVQEYLPERIRGLRSTR